MYKKKRTPKLARGASAKAEQDGNEPSSCGCVARPEEGRSDIGTDETSGERTEVQLKGNAQPIILFDDESQSDGGCSRDISHSHYHGTDDLEQAVSKALLFIPSELDKLLTRHYGLGSGIPETLQQQAKKEGSSVQNMQEKEATALRLLMGYGKRRLDRNSQNN